MRPRRPAPICLVLALLLALSTVSAGDEEPRTEGEIRAFVARCLRDLRSSEFDVRERARQGLETYGERARDLLLSAREDADPEVRRTVRLLLDRAGAPLAAPPSPPENLDVLGRVRLEATGGVEVVLRALGSPYGARFVLPAEYDAPAPLEVKLVDVPFFAALERVAGDAGLVGHQPFDAAGSMVLGVKPEGEPAPWAAAGPMRIRVAEVTSVRTLEPPGGRRYVLSLDLHWTPSVQLVTYRLPGEIAAVDAEGRRFRAGAGMHRNTTYGVGTNSRFARLSLHLEPEDEGAAERLSRLAFVLAIRLRYDRGEVTFEALDALELPVAKGDDERVTLHGVTPPEEGRGPWVVDVTARLNGDVALNSLSVLLDRADGTARAASAGSRFPSADGRVALSARAYGRWEEPPVAVRVAWFRQEEEGELAFELKDVPLR